MYISKLELKVDLRPVLKAWALMFTVLFMPGLFSRMVYNVGANDPITPLFTDVNLALILFTFMIIALPVLWFADRLFGVIPSKDHCYVMIFVSLGACYLAGYLASGATAMAAVLFFSAICVITICVLKRYVWYVDDLWIFSIIATK